MSDHFLLNPCPTPHSAHGLREMPSPWQLLGGAAAQMLASASAAHAGAMWQHSGMLGALQIHAADRERERDPSTFSSHPNVTAGPGRWSWSWPCCLPRCSMTAAWPSFGDLPASVWPCRAALYRSLRQGWYHLGLVPASAHLA